MDENPIYESQYTIQQIEDSIGKSPIIDPDTKEWKVWDIGTSAYVGTGIIAESETYAEAAAASAQVAQDYADNIADPVGGIVTQWIADNLSQEAGYVIDTSLTVQGAAADAKATGTKLSGALTYRGTANRSMDLNSDTFTVGGQWYCSSGNYPANFPFTTGAARIVTFGNDSSSGGKVQMAFSANGNVAFRYKAASAWYNWRYLVNSYTFANYLDSTMTDSTKAANAAAVGDEFAKTIRYNSVTESTAESIYNNSAANLPVNTCCFINPAWFTDMSIIPASSGWLVYYSVTSSVGRTQIFVSGIDGRAYSRYCPVAGEWYTWKEIGGINNPDIASAFSKVMSYNSINQTAAEEVYENLASNLPINTRSWISSSWFTDMSDAVDSGTGWLFYFAATQTVGRTQIFIIGSSGKIFIRYTGTNDSWYNWREVGNKRDRSAKYFAFGDSVVKGQKGTWSGGTSGTSANNYPAITGKVLNMVVENKAVGGQGICKDYAAIVSAINSLDMTGAKLITVGWAYNDRTVYPTLNFGTYLDTGDDTVVGKYYSIMAMLQQKCKDALVVWVSGYGYPGGDSSEHIYANLNNQFTHSYTFLDGQRTVKEMYDELEKMCHLHGWCCVNQSNGCAFNKFNADIVFGDNVHPVDAGYAIYSNNISARIAALYQNYKF